MTQTNRWMCTGLLIAGIATLGLSARGAETITLTEEGGASAGSDTVAPMVTIWNAA